MKNKKALLVVFSIMLFTSNCNNDDNNSPNNAEDLTENIEVYNSEKIQDNLTFVVGLGKKNSFLIDKKGKIIKNWDFEDNFGNDIKLLPNSNLIGMFRTETDFNFGGGGGLIKLFNFDGEELWSYTYSDVDRLAHHDILQMNNGNILFAAWERLTVEDAKSRGINTEIDLFPESIIEVNPQTNEIVWKWNSADHGIQNMFPEITDTYGQISENPHKINLNYNLEGGNGHDITNGNIMHFNGLFYDEEKDVIFISVLQYGEVWVIDHSTTTEQAATDVGGNYNKGGNLLYRFGNPMAYQNSNGLKRFYRTHTPVIIPEGYPGAGNFMVYMNGDNTFPHSEIYEFKLPEVFSLGINQDNEPQEVWKFQHPELYYDKVSGAVRLSNGNTLICEGDYGLWEVTPLGEIVWKYNANGLVWRAYDFDKNHPALNSLD